MMRTHFATENALMAQEVFEKIGFLLGFASNKHFFRQQYDKPVFSQKGHTLVIGETRCGLTQCIMLPNILRATENLIVFDRLAELWGCAHKALDASSKTHLMRFDITEPSAAWNPLEEINAKGELDIGLAKCLARVIIDRLPNKIHALSQKNVTTFVENIIMAFCVSHKRVNFKTFSHWLSQPIETIEK